MKKEATILIAVVAVLALVFAAIRASNRTAPVPASVPTVTAPPAVPTPAPSEASVRRIEPQELQTLLGRGAVTVIDVRDADSYVASHIAGSLHIPLSRIEGEIAYLPRDKPIVTYCT